MSALRTLCILVTLAIAALFIAQGTGYWIAGRIMAAADAAARKARSAAATKRPLATETERHSWAVAQKILARNMFDSATGPLWPPPPPPPSVAEQPQESGPMVEPRCNTEARIAIAFHDPQRPERSWVVLRGPELGPGRPYSPGMRVGDRTVEHIEPEAVRLAAPDGKTCWIGMFNPTSRAKVERELAAQAVKAGSKSARRARRRGADAAPPFSERELEAGVRSLGARRYMIRRHLFEKARAHAADIAGATRVARARGRARGQGMRITRLREKGLLAHLGLERGDILQNINGVPASNAAALSAAYATLDRSSRITVGVLRDREQLRFEYVIQ